MTSSNTKILTAAVVLLLLVNIAMIVLMLKGKNAHDGRNSRGKGGDPFEMMAKELGMTDQQKSAHIKFRDEYFVAGRPLFDSVRAAKEAFFSLLKDTSASDSLINAYAHKIGERQLAADKLTFEHFKRVRSLYSGDQQKKYDEIVQKNLLRSGGKKKDSANKGK